MLPDGYIISDDMNFVDIVINHLNDEAIKLLEKMKTD
jgi:hypothetical protein